MTVCVWMKSEWFCGYDQSCMFLMQEASSCSDVMRLTNGEVIGNATYMSDILLYNFISFLHFKDWLIFGTTQ